MLCVKATAGALLSKKGDTGSEEIRRVKPVKFACPKKSKQRASPADSAIEETVRGARYSLDGAPRTSHKRGRTAKRGQKQNTTLPYAHGGAKRPEYIHAHRNNQVAAQQSKLHLMQIKLAAGIPGR